MWKGSLERDPQVMCKNMLVAGRVIRQACSLTILTIDRDTPPRLPLPLEVAARDERARTTFRASVDSSSSISPGRCIISGWDERA